jgi:hypothetical protein
MTSNNFSSAIWALGALAIVATAPIALVRGNAENSAPAPPASADAPVPPPVIVAQGRCYNGRCY